MENLSKDILMLLAMEMDLPSLLNFCESSKKINDKVCKQNIFWKNKLEKERPGLVSLLSIKLFDNVYDFDYKFIYNELYKTRLANLYSIKLGSNPLEIYGAIKGDLEYDFGLTPLQHYTDDNLLGTEVWIAASNMPQYTFDPMIFHDKFSASKIIEEEIIRSLENVDYTQEEFNEKIQYFNDQLERNNFVKIDELEFLIKEVQIL